MNPLVRALALAGLCLSLAAPTATAQSAEVADSLYQAEDWEQAALAYQRLAEADTTNGRYWYRLGTALRNTAEYDAALMAFLGFQKTGAAPASINNFELGKTYALMGQADSAWTALERAVQANYSNVQALETDPALAALRADAAFTPLLLRVKENAQPCEYIPAYRQFDFWVGDWNVTATQSGNPAGRNRIERIENGCLLYEQWIGATGGTGKSINYYDPAKEKWVQHWVSNAAIINIEGGLEGDSMVLTGTITYRTGAPLPFRGTWTPQPDGRVRQFFEQSNDEGQTWTPWFDGTYATMEEEE